MNGERLTLEDLRVRKAAYQALGEAARADLASFCGANASCWHVDARVHAMFEGRREVWLRIQQHLELTPEELLARAAPNQKVDDG